MTIRTKFACVIDRKMDRMMFLEKERCGWCDEIGFITISGWIPGTDVTVEKMNAFHVPVKSKLTVTEEMPNLIEDDGDTFYSECCDRCFDMEYTDGK